MAKVSNEFKQTVFSKRKDGVEYWGVIVCERFYPVDGPLPGHELTCRMVDGKFEYLYLGWRVPRSSFSI